MKTYTKRFEEAEIEKILGIPAKVRKDTHVSGVHFYYDRDENGVFHYILGVDLETEEERQARTKGVF